MLHDPQIYRDPNEFLPERFMTLDAGQAAFQDPRQLAFGFGRRYASSATYVLSYQTLIFHVVDRLCPGQNLADASIFLVTAYDVATMDIARSQDDLGNDVVPPADFHSVFVV